MEIYTALMSSEITSRIRDYYHLAAAISTLVGWKVYDLPVSDLRE
jgi:hypothetical protein